MPRSTCLARALAAERLLRAQGCDSTIVIGVAESGALGDAAPPLDAHAWVESAGLVVVGDGELGRYRSLVRIDSSR